MRQKIKFQRYNFLENNSQNGHTIKNSNVEKLDVETLRLREKVKLSEMSNLKDSWADNLTLRPHFE